MIGLSRGLGYKPDSLDERDFRYGASAAPALPPVLSKSPDLTSYIGRVRDQGGTSSCVGQALAAAIELTSLACDGKPLHLSARHLYAMAREAERTGLPLQDEGSFPRLALRAAQARGVVPERSFPFSEDTIDERPPPALSVSAYELRGLSFYRLEAEGNERLEALDDALRRGCGVLFGAQVSVAYGRNRGELVSEMGPAAGGHMQVLVRGGPAPLVLNSWGTGWGHRGLCPWDRGFLGGYPLSDIYVVTQVPHV